ncbi:uncharacterized protein TNIN_92791 [Trichonephila inaurata madagascariensis]|uniref:Uncharacterized protein n=1 Tax=Trichonephila inaurata madagascariensis TaxID=2747483 RepID=A0A8X7BX72_9ARAC|nr:uncharacterized protein TNIN_92791 [Trichonephila inaurata madagascariensis]
MVTGANRGIGLEFVRQLIDLTEPPRHIFATYRNADSLKELKEIEESSIKTQVILIKMDVTDAEEVGVAKSIIENTVGERGLNLLINNAGVAKMQPFPTITSENLEFHFKVNTEGPILILQTMLPSLEKAAKFYGGGMSASRAMVLNISSMVGSICNTGVNFTHDLAVPGYKISKVEELKDEIGDQFLDFEKCSEFLETHQANVKDRKHYIRASHD